ncbi:nitrate- and nitrite sensing domain-containing protein [Streptacidiphilus sp. N1-12]|uniref:Nitrate- and nitrite sensing domain-containing protein n=2 Tax=Streptacidiphilus alkalitolerans TaxID=3342712 RepID=A0ABV6VL12_9ACTN
MRFRSRSVRARIIALLLIPLASLTGLWAYTTASSVDHVWGLIRIDSVYPWIGTPADYLARSLQDERRAAVTYSAAPAGKGNLDALHQAEVATDKTAAVVTSHAADSGKFNSLNSGQRKAVSAVVAQIGRLPVLRAEAADHRLAWMSVYQDYTDAQAPFFDLQVQLSDLQAGDLTREAGNLIELFRAREYISREDALMYGARATGTFGTIDYQAFLASSKGEQLLFQTHEGQLPDQEAALYQDFTGGPVYGELGSLETAVANLGQPFAAQRIDGKEWQTTLDQAMTQLGDIDYQAVTLAGNRARSYAMDIIWNDAAVGAAGLVAVLVSVLLSLSIGRRLVRELTGLRDSAFDLAGVRLPGVMRRLREGERVDLAVEVPQVPVGGADRDEIAQVGRAFNAVQRSALEAAVEQAELRRGIAAVFVNLARRSQALLHRQLTLLDEMERRADDPDELEDLFRLDHLTTRMRRHAEGLIILSGSAPGRNWRRPVRILDVVRAAVGEIEDYARVRVHRMPPVAVVGGAVSDVVHLVAELVENAAVFSPPHTQVRIQGEEVANGFVLEIDDRGLGMGEDAMAAANTRLATGGDFDLTDTDRLGLFVISRLSSRHGVQVSLRRSPYGGTTAVVLLPRELLAAVSARPGDAAGAGGAAQGDGSEQALAVRRNRAGRELAPGGRGGAGDGGQLPVQHRGPRHAAPIPALEVELDGEGGEQGVAALPRRRPPAAASPSRAEAYLAARDGALAGDPHGGVPSGTPDGDLDGGLRDSGDHDGGLAEGGGWDGGFREGEVRHGGYREAVLADHGDGEATRELTLRQSPGPATPPSSTWPLTTPSPDPAAAGASGAGANTPAAPRANAPTVGGNALAGAAAPGGPSPVPAAPPAPLASAEDPPLLPRRVRQANLAPQLRAATEGAPSRPSPEPSAPRERSPEEVRATFASFQSGLSRGRATADPTPATTRAPATTTPAGPAPVDAVPAARPGGAPDPSAEGPVR